MKDSKNTNTSRDCLNCDKHFFYSSSHKRKFCSVKCANEGMNIKRGEESPLWKGEEAKYQALHAWARGNLNKPDKCESCGTTEGRIEWSNKDHKYKRKQEDWQRLCKSCHNFYDNEYFSRTKKYYYKGIEDTVRNWASFFGMSKSTLYSRMHQHKWPIERALHTPVKKYNYV